MSKNIGMCERFIRAIVGVIIGSAAFYKFSGGWQVAGYIVSAILIITSIIRYCPLYALFGMDSTKCSCGICKGCQRSDTREAEVK